MPTAPQLAANRANSLASTGPRTAQGKDHASLNAVTFGLFALHDFVRPDERDEYARFGAEFAADLNPQGAIERTLVAAIVGASWRLRRCSLVEAALSDTAECDPMAAEPDTPAARTQRSVDRARAHTLLRRSLVDLRRLQTERAIGAELFANSGQSPDPGLIEYRTVNRALNEFDRGRLLAKKLSGLDSLAGILNQPLPAPPSSSSAPSAELASFCNRPTEPAATPRNAPCPCGSGAKFKRCCGRSPAPVLSAAA